LYNNDHDYGANLSGVDGAIVSNCSIGVERGVDVRCVESQTSEFGGYMDDIIVANNVTYNAGNRCLQVEGDDGIWIGNRVSGSAKDGIGIFGIDNIVANNRVSDSANTDITNSGTGTVLDGNLTGASN